MASIGGYTVRFLSGVLAPQSETVEVLDHPGIDGVARRQLGKKPVDSSITTWVDLANIAATQTTFNNYMGLRKTKVTVVDETGTSWSNVFVDDVQLSRRGAIANSVGGLSSSSRAFLECHWTLQRDW